MLANNKTRARSVYLFQNVVIISNQEVQLGNKCRTQHSNDWSPESRITPVAETKMWGIVQDSLLGGCPLRRMGHFLDPDGYGVAWECTWVSVYVCMLRNVLNLWQVQVLFWDHLFSGASLTWLEPGRLGSKFWLCHWMCWAFGQVIQGSKSASTTVRRGGSTWFSRLLSHVWKDLAQSPSHGEH